MPAHIYLFTIPTATTEIYTLSLHDALPIFEHLVGFLDVEESAGLVGEPRAQAVGVVAAAVAGVIGDRKSTRLNSSHRCISYAVFCLKKKKYKCIVVRCRVFYD